MSHEMTTSKRDAAFDDPSILSPHERLCELTAILASGIHRLKGGRRPKAGGLRGITPAVPERSTNTPVFSECSQIPGKFSQTGLDAVATTRPDGVVLTTRERGD